MSVEEPQDPSAENIERIAAGVTEKEPAVSTDTRPNIVAIMNESWADFEDFGNLSLSESVTDYIDSLDNLIFGHTYTSVFGAGTSASEFEFLTGNSMAFLPSGSIPYQQYILEPSASLASLLRENGYRTLAFHPGERTSWQRNQAYPLLGFDEFKCVEDMDVPVTEEHGYVSDQSSFSQIIYEFEHKDPEERLFLFNVTIQNHGSYTVEDYPAEVQEIPSVQSGYETNIEQIIALEPQVLLMSTMAQTEEQIKALEDAGVHVVVSDAQDIEGTYAAIRMIGALLGKNEEAETVIDGMKTTFESLKGVCGDGEKTIYFEVSPLEYGLWTAGANTFMNEIAELLGLKNCFADVEGWAEISEEQVLERNPDYILTISMYFGEGPTPEEEIASRAGWENVTAVKNGAILNLQNNELSRPAPRLAEGAQMLADFIAGVEANDKAA